MEPKTKDLQAQLRDAHLALKANMVEIPISEIIDVVYTPTNDDFHVLVASPKWTEIPKGTLIYVEKGSQHNMINLFDIPKEPSSDFPDRVMITGLYDRAGVTRDINIIYLHNQDVLTSSYFGTLDDLMSNPNIRRK